MKTLIIIPTYNEKENIGPLLQAIRSLGRRDIEVLVVDDSSPDGTGDEVRAQAIASAVPIHLLTRLQKQGLGKAYAAGFEWALARNYTHIVSMDADFSHRPEDLPGLLDADSHADIVIGSRYIPGGHIVGWGLKRHINSRLANVITRLALGLKPKDVTAGFKRYSRRFLASLNFAHVISSGYAFQVEMIFQAVGHGFSVIEVPITFEDRKVGASKISGELRRSVKIVWKLALRRDGFRQFIKFCAVGSLNAVIDWGLFAVFKVGLRSFGQNGRQLAKASSFVVAATSSYVLNRRWTFRSRNPKIAHEASRFVLVSIIGLLANNAIFYAATAPGWLHLNDLFGLIIASAVVMLWNFYANRHWTFK